MATNQVGFLQAEGASRVHIGNNYGDHKEPSLDPCLVDLRLTNPSDDKERIERQKGGLLKNACSWILSHNDFVKWRNNETSRLLWIKGDPGKGKTMLLCSIINELKGSLPDGCILSFFFCQATDQNLNNATAVLRGIIYMLVDQDRSLLKPLQEEYKKAGRRLFEDGNAWDALSRIFNIMLQMVDGNKSLVFVIDALDECEKGASELSRLVLRHSTKSQVQWIVSSRNLANIEEVFKSDNQLRLCLELNEKSISTAVDLYIQEKVEELTKAKGYKPDMRSEVKSYLSSHANDTFLWVALICQRLRDPMVQTWRTMKELQSFPSGLDCLYERMARYIYESDDADLCNQVIAVVLILYRPITLQELACLVDWPEGFDANLESMGILVKLCGSFLTLQGDVVRFIHQSANDFLQRNAQVAGIFPLGIKRAHYTIFSQSIKAMSASLRRDVYNLKRPDYEIREELGITPPDPDPLAPLRYSCSHWVDHLVMACSASYLHHEDIQDNGTVHIFFKKHYLHWLEALSLLKAIPNGITTISKLLQLVMNKAKTLHLVHLIDDAIRFLVFHQTMIGETPLQLYTSALIFSPNQSTIKMLFQGDEQNWLTTNWIKEYWPPGLTVREFEDLVCYDDSVAFSYDSKLMAVRLHRAIEVWSVVTGKLRIRIDLEGDFVARMSFSPDSRLLAVVTRDSMIEIWSIGTGKLEQPLTSHIYGISSIVFSPDSRLLAMATRDSTIEIWSVGTGKLEQALEGHTHRVTSVAFSSDSKLVVSASVDKTVRMWSVSDGAQQAIINYMHSVTLVGFSPDEKLIVSCLSDKRICMSSVDKMSEEYYILDKDRVSNCPIAFSPNSQLIAYSAHPRADLWYRQVIRIWTFTGVLQRTIEISTRDGPFGPVLSVVFSPDSESVIVVTHKGAIRVFRISTGVLKQIIRDPDEPVNYVVFSRDKRLAALIEYTHIRICVTGTDIMDISYPKKQPLTTSLASKRRNPSASSYHDGFYSRDYDISLGPIIFSPTSKHFALCRHETSSFHVIEIWSVETGEVLQVVSTAGPHSLDFDPSGGCLCLHYRSREDLWSSRPPSPRYESTPGRSKRSDYNRERKIICPYDEWYSSYRETHEREIRITGYLEVKLGLQHTTVDVSKDVASGSVKTSLDQALKVQRSGEWAWLNGKRFLRLPSYCQNKISGSTLVSRQQTGKVFVTWFSAEVLRISP
ncbi:hypothetical protein F5Y04DRAFT_240976 [Hypomontagnella monticulosa]|nr:hypothetical protein F5Y04DRAFT_240976 [Hypomontagnella monticulosa]